MILFLFCVEIILFLCTAHFVHSIVYFDMKFNYSIVYRCFSEQFKASRGDVFKQRRQVGKTNRRKRRHHGELCGRSTEIVVRTHVSRENAESGIGKNHDILPHGKV